MKEMATEADEAAPELYSVEIAGVRRDLPLRRMSSGVRVAVLNLLGDVELVERCADGLCARLVDGDERPEVVLTPEAKSIALAHAMALRLKVPYVVLRKRHRAYMGDEPCFAEATSITGSGSAVRLYIDERDRQLLDRRKKVLLLDDVVSTGSTQRAMRQIVQRCGARVVAEAAVLTEGDEPDEWLHVQRLGHLPLWH